MGLLDNFVIFKNSKNITNSWHFFNETDSKQGKIKYLV